MLAQISNDGWVAIGGIGMTLGLAVLSLLVSIIGYLLHDKMKSMKEDLDVLPDLVKGMAVLASTSGDHTKRLDRHSTLLGQHDKSIEAHSIQLGHRRRRPHDSDEDDT